MASLSKSIAVKPFLMKTVSESHLIDDDASSQNGAGKQVPSSPKTKNITRVSFVISARIDKSKNHHKGTKQNVIAKKDTLITIQTSLEDSSDPGTRRSWDEREGNIYRKW